MFEGVIVPPLVCETIQGYFETLWHLNAAWNRYLKMEINELLSSQSNIFTLPDILIKIKINDPMADVYSGKTFYSYDHAKRS